jgi:hypothetical protein
MGAGLFYAPTSRMLLVGFVRLRLRCLFLTVQVFLGDCRDRHRDRDILNLILHHRKVWHFPYRTGSEWLPRRERADLYSLAGLTLWRGLLCCCSYRCPMALAGFQQRVALTIKALHPRLPLPPANLLPPITPPANFSPPITPPSPITTPPVCHHPSRPAIFSPPIAPAANFSPPITPPANFSVLSSGPTRQSYIAHLLVYRPVIAL